MPVAKHAFQSAKNDGADASKVRASNWNADHPLSYTVQTKSSNYTIATDGDGVVSDDVIRCSGTMTLTVPAATGSGKSVIVVADSGAVAITVARTGSDAIGTGTGFTVAAVGDSFVLVDEATGTWGLLYLSGSQLAFNASTASQSISAATRTYITGSAIKAPFGGFKIGSTFVWRIQVTKTAAGTASSTYAICFGTAGDTSDTTRISFTKPAGTAAADTAFIDIICSIRGPLSSSCVAVGTFRLTHNLQSTGHATIAGVAVNTVSSGFDITAATTVGICVTSGASDALTIQQVLAEGRGL